MEIAVPLNNMDFDFNSPYGVSAPSTPRLTGDHYISAPSSPTRLSEFCREFEDMLIAESNRNSCATVPFAWEERPGKPKSPTRPNYEDDFAFDIRGELGSFENSLSAEDLFDGGVIKPLKPPPRLQPAPFSPRERERKKKKEGNATPERQRGRERGNSGLTSSASRRTRSLSPLRVSEYPWEEEQQAKAQPAATTTTSTRPPLPSPTTASTALLSVSSSKGSKKWSLKDLFLFRSASDGRAMDRDPFKKYTTLLRKHEEFKNASLRAFEQNNGSGSVSKRRGRVSAHELHYAVNKAVSNDMKKKTFLPYKQGILGRLAFNPTVTALANDFGHRQK